MRRILIVSVSAAFLVAGCGDDDDGGVSGDGDSDNEVTTADDQEVADEAIATFEGVLRDEGFAVAADDDEDDELEFESDECREFDDAFPGDGGSFPDRRQAPRVMISSVASSRPPQMGCWSRCPARSSLSRTLTTSIA